MNIYIILSDSGTFPGYLVSKVTRFRYSHCMIALSNDCDELYSFGRRSLHNFLKGGFVTEKRDGQFFTYFSETNCCILAHSVTQEQYQALVDELAVFQVDAQRYRYDFLGCGLRLLGVRSVFDRRYTCSHFVAQLLENAKIHTFSAGTMMARPADFMNLPGIRVIYEGKLSDYRKSDAIFTIP